MPVREISFIDVSITLFAFVVGIFALNTAVGLWRQRNGGILLRAIVVKLIAFALWTVEILFSALYQWHVHATAAVVVRAITNLDRLTLSVPMSVLLIWVVPSIGKEKH